ncbi:MAG: peptidylprolyl isomerase [Actinomycetota bacterium]
MPSRARDRHLEKLAARRQAERRAARRRRNTILWTIGGLIAAAVVVAGVMKLTGNGTSTASGSVTPSASASASPTKNGLPQKTGTVTPQASPAKTVACGASVPKDAGKPKPQFASAPSPSAILKKGTTYTAVMKTSCGTITIALDATGTPNTVASFVFLADQRFFDGTFFHRVVDSIDVIQGGDPLGTGGGGPGYTIPDELTGKENYTAGTVAMAKGQAPNSGGSQFFIITGPQGTNLNGNPNYTIFGHVASGLNVAQKINALMPTTDGSYDGAPTEAVYIESVKILTKKTPPSPSATASPSA